MAKATLSGKDKVPNPESPKKDIDAVQGALMEGSKKNAESEEDKEPAAETTGGIDAPGADVEKNELNCPAPTEDQPQAGTDPIPGSGNSGPKDTDMFGRKKPIFEVFEGEPLTFEQVAKASENPGIVEACKKVVALTTDSDTEAGIDLLAESTEEDIERIAALMSENPKAIAQAEEAVKRAKQIIEAKNAPAPKTPEELEAEEYAKDVAKYGKDFVTAKRGEMTRKFARQAWVSMGANKNGWIEVTKKMPEVQ